LGTCPWAALAVTVRHAGHELLLLPIGREQRQCRLGDQPGNEDENDTDAKLTSLNSFG
jgi:hypothetical protein